MLPERLSAEVKAANPITNQVSAGQTIATNGTLACNSCDNGKTVNSTLPKIPDARNAMATVNAIASVVSQRQARRMVSILARIEKPCEDGKALNWRESVFPW